MTDESPTNGSGTTCPQCGKPIREGARRCPHCRSALGRRPFWRRPATWIAAAATILSLLFSLQRLHGVWSETRQARQVVAREVATARTLTKAGEFRAAWQSLERARDANPTDPEIGRAGIDVASAWLRAFGIPDTHASVPDTVLDTPGSIANTVYVPLRAAALAAKGSDRAELEGLAAWARYLRGREMILSRRVDIQADLEAALQHDDDAYYPNLYLGYWLADFREDPAAAAEPWARALEADAPGLRTYARHVQLTTLLRLANAWEDEVSARGRRALLQVLDEMRGQGESAASVVVWTTLARFWMDLSTLEPLEDALPAADQLAMLDWAYEDLEIADRHRDTRNRFRFLRARLQETLGRTDEAMHELEAMRAEGMDSRLADLANEAWMRLTGEPDRNEWTVRADTLRHAALDSPDLEEALGALMDLWSRWEIAIRVEFGDSFPTLDAAIDRISVELERGSGPVVGPWSRTELESTLRSLHLFRGLGRLRWDRFAEGLQETEALLLDPDLSPGLRGAVLAELARYYTYSPRRVPIDEIYEEGNGDVAWIYLCEGLDRLDAALAAGYSDWNSIESYYTDLQWHPGYAVVSMRYGRVPPRRDDADE